jgi:hypothetical protein
MNPIAKTLVKALLLLLSIPLFYYIAFGIASYFHKPVTDHSDISYGILLSFLRPIVLISLPALVFLHEGLIKKERISVLLHIGWFVSVCLFAAGALSYKPYRFGLLLACIGSTLVTRVLLNKVIK